MFSNQNVKQIQTMGELENLTDVNQPVLYLRAKAKVPMPPIFFAIEEGRTDILEKLIEKGADINIQIKTASNTFSPLFHAIYYKNEAALQLLKEKNVAKTTLKAQSPEEFAFMLAEDALKKTKIEDFFKYLAILVSLDQEKAFELFKTNDIAQAMIKNQSVIDLALAYTQKALESSKIKDYLKFLNIAMSLDPIKTTNYLEKYLSTLTTQVEIESVVKFIYPKLNNYENALIYPLFKQYKYFHYLDAVSQGDLDSINKIKSSLQPHQLNALNRAGFMIAVNQKNEADIKFYLRNALNEIKQQKLSPIAAKSNYLFAQSLYIKNLNYAIDLINQYSEEKIEKINETGVCSGFTKYWLFNELDETGNVQHNFFMDLMEIAALDENAIQEKINNRDEYFTTQVKSNAGKINILQKSTQFEGQDFSQAAMKKNFGLELVDLCKIDRISIKKYGFLFIGLSLKDGRGHAIAAYINPKDFTFKVWDPNGIPVTFNKENQFYAYIDSLVKSYDPKQIFASTFSPVNYPHYKESLEVKEKKYPHIKENIEKMETIDHFIRQVKNQITLTDQFPKNSKQQAILECFKLLIRSHDNGISPLNETIPLLVLLGKQFKEAGVNLADTAIQSLEAIIDKQYLLPKKNPAEPPKIDINKINFIDFLMEKAFSKNKTNMATLLLDMGFYPSPTLGFGYIKSMVDICKDYANPLAKQLVFEGNIPLLNRLQNTKILDEKNITPSFVLEEITRSPENNNAKNVFAYLLLKGKNFDEAKYMDLINMNPFKFLTTPSLSLSEVKKMILDYLLPEINKRHEATLDINNKEDVLLLTMLDTALNPQHKGEKGCYDILSYSRIFEKDQTDSYKKVLESLTNNHIKINPNCQAKYSFLYDNVNNPKSSFTIK